MVKLNLLNSKDSFLCPFTNERIQLSSDKWASYLRNLAKKYSYEQLSIIYINETDLKIKKILADILINLYNSVEQ